MASNKNHINGHTPDGAASSTATSHDASPVSASPLERPTPLKRSSISWHASADSSALERKRSIAMAAPDDDSHADETTAILAREQGGRREYNTTSTTAGASNGSPELTLRRTSTANRRRASPMPSRQPAPQDQDADENAESWWRRLLHKYGSVELENRGSVARDHLALERTFLAWLRTSLSFASIGIAVTQLFRLNTSLRGTPSTPGGPSEDDRLRLRHVGKPLGATFLAIAILILAVGFHRYFEAQHYIVQGKFPASRGSVLLITLVAGALIVASFVVIVSIAPQALE